MTHESSDLNKVPPVGPSIPEATPKAITDFVSREARRRITHLAVPTHLMQWTRDYDQEKAPGFLAGFSDLRNRETKLHNENPDRWSQRRQAVLKQQSEEFESVLKRDGRAGLIAMREIIEQRQHAEKERLHQLQEEDRWVEILLDDFCAPMLNHGAVDLEWKTDDFRGEVSYLSTCPDGFSANIYHVGGHLYGLEIRLETGRAERYELDTDTISDYPMRLEKQPETWADLHRALISRRKTGRIKTAEEIESLIAFRLHFLRLFIWVYDIVGDAFEVTDGIVIPETVHENPGGVKRTLIVLDVLGAAREAGMSLDSQSDLHRFMQKHRLGELLGVSVETITKAAKRMLQELGAETAGTKLFHSLNQHAALLRSWANRLKLNWATKNHDWLETENGR